jgi:hypothetical protein
VGVPSVGRGGTTWCWYRWKYHGAVKLVRRNPWWVFCIGGRKW